MKLNFTLRAKQDLLDIYNFSAEKWGIKQAKNYSDSFNKVFQTLQNNPKLGKNADHILKNYRVCLCRSYSIFYKVTFRIEIIRIIHQSRDYMRLVSGEVVDI